MVEGMLSSSSFATISAGFLRYKPSSNSLLRKPQSQSEKLPAPILLQIPLLMITVTVQELCMWTFGGVSSWDILFSKISMLKSILNHVGNFIKYVCYDWIL